MGIYPYKAIDPHTETRLLRIEPRDRGDNSPLVCSLIHVTLASPPPYEALSYVWGHSVVGPLNDADPETDTFGFNVSPLAPPKTIIRGKYKDFLDHPTLKGPLLASGYPRPKGAILIDGVEVEVGGELYAALKRLRSSWDGSIDANSEQIPVWIDALCIDQSNIEERNQHVLQMGEIYKKANKVRIWLGEEVSDGDRIGFENLTQISEFLEECCKMKEIGNRSMVQKRFFRDENMKAIQWGCLSALLNRAWFRRTWVIQEIAFASSATFHLGRFCFAWELLYGVVFMLRDLDLDQYLWAYTEFTADQTLQLMHKLHNSHTKSMEQEDEMTLLDILRQSRNFKCTFQSDKIYGVLGLAADADDYPAPDYSLEPSQVFRIFATTYISKTNDLSLLYHCARGPESSKLNLPSWVVDWSQPCHHTPFSLMALECNAAGSSTPAFRFSDNQNIIVTQGRLLDTIRQVEYIRNIPRNKDQSPKPVSQFPVQDGKPEGLYMPPDVDTELHNRWYKDEYRTNVREWSSNVMKMAFPDGAITAETFDSLWRTFVCNQTRDGKVPPREWGEQFPRFIAGLRSYDGDDRADWMEDILRPKKRNKYDLTERFDARAPGNLDAYNDFLHTNGTWCYNRRFFKTDTGRFGWGPDGVREGDVVAVFDGLRVPLVLRPVEHGYEVVGDCYTHGLMQGEAMDIKTLSQEIRLV